ncbi:MAG: response regulator transcription factor [Oscillospiraceae bacterium]|nr:response regulator transcription factor [Oscillospiraceae bacterium]
MRIVFCDDDPAALAQVRHAVEGYFRDLGGTQPEFAQYDDGDTLLEQERWVDIAFLDVEMPGSSGIETGVKLKQRNPFTKVFIVTAYPDYLDDAMGAQMFRFLTKPFDPQRLRMNLDKAVQQYLQDSRVYPVVTDTGVVMCRAEQIICVVAAQRRVQIHTQDGILLSTDNMDHWKNTLTLPCFYIPHRSYIINMRFVSVIGKDKILLKFGDRQMEAYLTRRRYTHFKDCFLQYLERG